MGIGSENGTRAGGRLLASGGGLGAASYGAERQRSSVKMGGMGARRGGEGQGPMGLDKQLLGGGFDCEQLGSVYQSKPIRCVKRCLGAL